MIYAVVYPLSNLPSPNFGLFTTVCLAMLVKQASFGIVTMLCAISVLQTTFVFALYMLS